MVTLEQIDKIQDAFEGKMFDEILNEHPYTDYFRAMIALAPCACVKSALLAAWGCLGFPMVAGIAALCVIRKVAVAQETINA